LAMRVSSGVFWEEIWQWIDAKAVNWAFIGRLALFVFLAAPVRGLLHRARDDGWAIAVVAKVAPIAWFLVFIALLLLLVAAGIKALVGRLQRI
jgi:hypothetical protein